MHKYIIAIVALAGTAGLTQAETIYSNLGPGDTYSLTGSTEAGPDAGGGAARQAFAFTMGSESLRFDNARLGLFLSGGANVISLRLQADNGGVPGTILDTIAVTGQIPPGGTNNIPVEFQSVLHPLLEEGKTYWLLPFASGNTLAGWADNNQNRRGPFAQSF